MPGIHFNLSHCGEDGVIALSASPVGIDIERVDRTLRNLDLLAGRILSPNERATYDALSPDTRCTHFFALWTAKEATVKALGTGLATPLTEIDIDLSKSRIRAMPGTPADWQLQHYPLLPGLCTAAVWRT